MSTPNPIQLPLDPTGTAASNLITGEIQNLTPNRNTRVIAPEYGAFFTSTMVVTDTATNLPLTSSQFWCGELYELPTARYGQEICALVLITDPTVSNTVSIQYQALGGPYGTSAQAIVQQIENLGLDNRPIAWGDIIDRPSAYPPSHHLHDIGDVYGFEYVVHALDRIRDAILIGDDAAHNAIYAYIDSATGDLQNAINAVQTNLNNHLQDVNNPHQVTAHQVGAYTMQESDTNLNTAVANVEAWATPQFQSLQTQVNGKVAIDPDIVYSNQSMNVQLGDITASGTIYSTGDVWAFNSDGRLKCDLKPIEDSLNKIKQLTGYRYRYTPEAINALPDVQDRDYLGFIAQEVQSVAPEIVGLAAFDRAEDGTSKSGMNFLTVQYDKVTALIVEAIKELDSKIQTIYNQFTSQGAF